MKKEVFIQKAFEAHGYKYSYDLVPEDFKTANKIYVLCKEHGAFATKVGNHITGKKGCPVCARDSIKNKLKLSEKEFKERLAILHPNICIDTSSYVNAHSQISATCSFHGTFQVFPKHLLRGHGCPKCSLTKSSESRSKGSEYYIPLFKSIHGDTYDYSQTYFKKSKDKFKVICFHHGQFETTATNHLKGKGCPRCGRYKSGYKSNLSGVFYILRITEDVCKFGISNNFQQRFEKIKSKCSFDIALMYIYEFSDGQIARNIESDIISSDIKRNVINKVDMRSGYTETFMLSDISKVLSIVSKYETLTKETYDS